jgi:hypothetical protein
VTTGQTLNAVADGNAGTSDSRCSTGSTACSGPGAGTGGSPAGAVAIIIPPVLDALLRRTRPNWPGAVGSSQRRSCGGAAGLGGGEGGAVESLVHEQVAWQRPVLRQVIAHVALVDGGGHDAPGADAAAASVLTARRKP